MCQVNNTMHETYEQMEDEEPQEHFEFCVFHNQSQDIIKLKKLKILWNHFFDVRDRKPVEWSQYMFFDPSETLGHTRDKNGNIAFADVCRTDQTTHTLVSGGKRSLII